MAPSKRTAAHVTATLHPKKSPWTESFHLIFERCSCLPCGDSYNSVGATCYCRVVLTIRDAAFFWRTTFGTRCSAFSSSGHWHFALDSRKWKGCVQQDGKSPLRVDDVLMQTWLWLAIPCKTRNIVLFLNWVRGRTISFICLSGTSTDAKGNVVRSFGVVVSLRAYADFWLPYATECVLFHAISVLMCAKESDMSLSRTPFRS